MVFGFDSRSLFSLPNFDWGENLIIFGVGNSLPVHIGNKKRYLNSRQRCLPAIFMTFLFYALIISTSS